MPLPVKGASPRLSRKETPSLLGLTSKLPKTELKTAPPRKVERAGESPAANNANGGGNNGNGTGGGGGGPSVPLRVRVGAKLDQYNINQNLVSLVKLQFARGENVLYHYSQEQDSGYKVCDETLDCLVMTNKRFIQIQNHVVTQSVMYKDTVKVQHTQGLGWGDKLVVVMLDQSEKAFTVSSSRIAAFFYQELKNLTSGGPRESVMDVKEIVEEAPDFMVFGRSVLAMMALTDDMRHGVTNHPPLKRTRRTLKFVTYPLTFLAKEAVEWVMAYCKIKNIMISIDTGEKRRVTVSDARLMWMKKGVKIAVMTDHVVELLEQMRSSNIITGINCKPPFQNNDDCYRFSDDRTEKSKLQILNESARTGGKSFPMLKAPKAAADILTLSATLLATMLEAVCSFPAVQQGDYLIKHEMFSGLRKNERFRASCEATQMLGLLPGAALDSMNDRQKFCFFFNIFNMLALHSCIDLFTGKKEIEEGLFGNEFNFSKTVYYQIGAVTYSLFEIEHKILRPQLQENSSSLKTAVLGAVTKQQPREFKGLCAPCSGWIPAMNFALFRGDFESPRIHIFERSDDLERQLLHCTRDFLFRHIRVAFKPAKQKGGLKVKFYVPAVFKNQKHEFGSSVRDFLSWLIPLSCPLSLQIRIFCDCEVSKSKLKYLAYNSSFYVDVSHIKGQGKPFGVPLKIDLKLAPDKDVQVWLPDEQDGLQRVWLDSLTSLEELRKVVLAGKATNHPLGKVMGSYVQRFRTIYENVTLEKEAEDALHPGLVHLMETLCGFHALVCRSENVVEDEDILPDNTPIATALKGHPAEWGELLKQHSIEELGGLRRLSESKWQQLPQTLRDDLTPLKQQDEKKQIGAMTELSCLKVLVEGLYSNTFPLIFQWYKRKYKQEEENMAWTRKHFHDTISLGGLGVEDFFWLTEEQYIQSDRLKTELLPYAAAIRRVEEISALAKQPAFQPNALLEALVGLIGLVSGAVTQFWENLAKEGDSGEGDRPKAPRGRRNLSADDLVMILAYVFIQADLENFYAITFCISDFMETTQQMPENAVLSARMFYEDQYLGQAGFVLTTIQLSLRFMVGKLHDQGKEEANGSKTQQSLSDDRNSDAFESTRTIAVTESTRSLAPLDTRTPNESTRSLAPVTPSELTRSVMPLSAAESMRSLMPVSTTPTATTPTAVTPTAGDAGNDSAPVESIPVQDL